LPSQDRTTSPGKKVVEQHEATVGPGAATGWGVEGAGAGFVISKLSMALILPYAE
jgi:hypothetical protein